MLHPFILLIYILTLLYTLNLRANTTCSSFLADNKYNSFFLTFEKDHELLNKLSIRRSPSDSFREWTEGFEAINRNKKNIFYRGMILTPETAMDIFQNGLDISKTWKYENHEFLDENGNYTLEHRIYGSNTPKTAFHYMFANNDVPRQLGAIIVIKAPNSNWFHHEKSEYYTLESLPPHQIEIWILDPNTMKEFPFIKLSDLIRS